MPRGKSAGQQTLRYKAAIIFALTSLLPLLLFLYVLNQKDLLQDTDAAGALALSVLIAVLGFALFQQTVRSISRMASAFIRLEQGEIEELGEQQATHEFARDGPYCRVVYQNPGRTQSQYERAGKSRVQALDLE